MKQNSRGASEIHNYSELHYYSEHLMKKLQNMCFAGMTVVEAPSGYGKTTAVRDFLERSLPQGTPVCWFNAVEEAPAECYRRLCNEIKKIDQRAGERLLQLGLPNVATVGEVCDALLAIECGQESYLVIDNYQCLGACLPPAFFATLLEHGGKGLHVILLTHLLGREDSTTAARRGCLHITTSDLQLSYEDILKYYKLSGVIITPEQAKTVERYTEGWIISVYLQLRSYKDTGAFSETAILSLMEKLVWNQLTTEQQEFMLVASLFETATAAQLCALMGFEVLPRYALDVLENPFIRYDKAEFRYEPHNLLLKLIARKRTERGKAFAAECLVRAGDYCRENNNTTEAFRYYAQAGDYERMLGLNFVHIILDEIDGIRFSEYARDITRKCSAEIKRENLLPMLRIAWALALAGEKERFFTLLMELEPMIREDESPERNMLMGEWLLLFSHRNFPWLENMLPGLRQAAELLQDNRSRVILPEAPWCFGSHSPLAVFHTRAGKAEIEADQLEEYVSLFSRITGGFGCGADILYRAELAFQRGDLVEAEILAHKAAYKAEEKRQSVVQLGAAEILGEISLHKSDPEGWQSAIQLMERAASGQNSYIIASTLDIVRGMLFNELHKHNSIAEWLQNGDLTPLRTSPGMLPHAALVHMNLLVRRENYAKLVAMGETIVPEGSTTMPFGGIVLSLLVAIGYSKLGRYAEALTLVRHALEIAVPDGMLQPVAVYSVFLDGLPERLLKNEYNEAYGLYQQIKERFESGLENLSRALSTEELLPDLTEREYEVARLAADGLRNEEIARQLRITRNTVRFHLRTVFQKLDVDRRALLSEKLK